MARNVDGRHYLYRSSKAALNAVVKSLSVDLRPRGVTAVALHPGWVQTDMGGANAPLTADASVDWMRHTIAKLPLRHRHVPFIDYDGSPFKGW